MVCRYLLICGPCILLLMAETSLTDFKTNLTKLYITLCIPKYVLLTSHTHDYLPTLEYRIVVYIRLVFFRKNFVPLYAILVYTFIK